MTDLARQRNATDIAAQTVTFVYVDDKGTEHQVSGQVGETLMSIARDHQISGIDGDCGGNCACGTCCIEISSLASELKLAEAGADERDLLSFVKDTPGTCRLGCQIELCPGLAGARISVVSD